MAEIRDCSVCRDKRLPANKIGLMKRECATPEADNAREEQRKTVGFIAQDGCSHGTEPTEWPRQAVHPAGRNTPPGTAKRMDGTCEPPKGAV